jgi:hypothetical protein
MVLADEIVLAVDTPEIAVAEEDVPNAACPDEKGLLANMGCSRRHNRKIAGIAAGDVSFPTVVAAVVGAQRACIQHRVQQFHALMELAGFQQRQI